MMRGGARAAIRRLQHEDFAALHPRLVDERERHPRGSALPGGATSTAALPPPALVSPGSAASMEGVREARIEAGTIPSLAGEGGG